MERKGQTNKSRGYMLFTGAMILCCIGLYLAQGISWPGRAPAEPTPCLLYTSDAADEL